MSLFFTPADALLLFFNPLRNEVYTLEYTAEHDFVSMPLLFVKRFFNGVPENIVLTDPMGNQCYLVVVKHCGVVDLAGWLHVGHFYGLTEGADIRLIYLGAGNFFIQAFTDAGVEVNYPPLPTLAPMVPIVRSPAEAPPAELTSFDMRDYFIIYLHAITADEMMKNVLSNLEAKFESLDYT